VYTLITWKYKKLLRKLNVLMKLLKKILKLINTTLHWKQKIF